jgi:hypothetical protein
MNWNAVDMSATHGWKVSSVTGHMSHPARKKILKVQGYQAKDLVYEPRVITVTLIQKFATEAEIFPAVDIIHDQISDNDIHEVNISGHDISFYAVARDGARVNINKRTVTVTITFTEVTV